MPGTTTVHVAAVNPVLLRLAEEAELVERDGEDLAPGEDAGWLDDLADDSAALDALEQTFAVVLDTTLEAADDSDPVVAPDLDLDGHGPALVMRLFLSWRDGVRITELADASKEAATIGLEAEEADKQWQEWLDAHGAPLQLLLGQLERLGAVSVTDDTARLEPLGSKPSARNWTGTACSSGALGTGQDDPGRSGAGVHAWQRRRPRGRAGLMDGLARRGAGLRELLAFAAGGTAAARTAAVTIVARLGPAAEPAWREALDRAELRCYAKPQPAKLAGLDPEGADLPAELQSERADFAWLIADMFGPFSQLDLGKERFPFNFADLQRVSGFEKPDEVFEAIARLDHPDAEAVLAMIGKHASDKATAKAARRAAYKASTRRAARR